MYTRLPKLIPPRRVACVGCDMSGRRNQLRSLMGSPGHWARQPRGLGCLGFLGGPPDTRRQSRPWHPALHCTAPETVPPASGSSGEYRADHGLHREDVHYRKLTTPYYALFSYYKAVDTPHKYQFLKRFRTEFGLRSAVIFAGTIYVGFPTRAICLA